MRSGFQKNGNGFDCGFSSSGAPVQQLLPVFTKTELGHRGKTSCFILAALLFKDLEHSLSHLIAARSPSSLSLSPLLLTSGPVKPLTELEMEGVRLHGEVCVFKCVFYVCACVSVCVHVSKRTHVYSVVRIHVFPSDSVCALFKPTVSKGL